MLILWYFAWDSMNMLPSCLLAEVQIYACKVALLFMHGCSCMDAHACMHESYAYMLNVHALPHAYNSEVYNAVFTLYTH